MSIKEYIGGQCANPEGLGGLACAKFMNFSMQSTTER